MNELCVTFDEIENWLIKATASNKVILPLALTKDNRFALERKASPEDPGRLAAFVCYNGFCEVVTTASDAVSVVEENYNQAFL